MEPLTSPADAAKPRYLLLSSSLLVDRVFMHTRLVEVLSQLGEVEIWASSFSDDSGERSWADVAARVSSFPRVRSFRERPYNYLRRLNEFVWDFRFVPPSRMSMMAHVRDKNFHRSIKALKGPARAMAALRLERVFERNLEKLLLSYPRSQEATERLLTLRPSAVVLTGPFQFEQPAIFGAASKLGIPTIAYIPSWDNVTTKNRMVFNYDGYIVWNDKVKAELMEFYPESRKRPIFVVGAPQFDVFYQDTFFQSREDYCQNQGLDPRLPIILYAIGSPNFLKEHHGAVQLAKYVESGRLGNVQLLIRPHPIHDNAEMQNLFGGYGSRVFLQKSINAGKPLTKRTQDDDQIVDWVNTFRHADVVVNTVSTVTIDAAIFDRPVINLDFDTQPGQPDQALVKDVNHTWPHYKPIAESGGVWLVNDFEEMVEAILGYLKDPTLHQAKRRWMVEHVCQYTDGRSGERMAQAIAQFVQSLGSEHGGAVKANVSFHSNGR